MSERVRFPMVATKPPLIASILFRCVSENSHMASKRQSTPESLGELFEGFYFQVPRYQRYYSWDKEQLEDLWTDLQTLPADKDHYFGTVILQETPESENKTPGRVMAEEQEKHYIIDGQQRITTISVLFKTMFHEIGNVVGNLDEPERWRESLEEIERKWIVDEGLYRLHLQKGDRDFFHNYVIEDQEQIDPSTPSERRLAFAKSFFREQFVDMRESTSPAAFIEQCQEIRKQVSSLELMVHYVGAGDDEKATRIFESENDRGKKLSMLERTKSFLMYMTYRSADEGDGSFERTIGKVQSSFSRIYEYVQSIEDADRDSLSEDGIQRYHYITYASWGTRDEYQGEAMLDSLKTNIRRDHAQNRDECLRSIEDYTHSLELAFKHVEDILTYPDDDRVLNSLNRIYTLGNVARFYPLLVLAWEKYEDINSRARLIDIIETAIIRLYAIGGHPSHAKRPRFHRIARDSSPETTVDEWRREISKAVGDFEDDESFRRVLKSQDFYSDQQSKQTRYLLYFYEEHLCEIAGEPEVPSFGTVMGEGYEVEHIWPQSPEEYPTDKDDYDSLIHRLGNLTIVSDEYNKEELQNKLFESKQPEFRKSSYRLNREKIADRDSWGEEEITSREDDELVPFILDRWALEDR